MTHPDSLTERPLRWPILGHLLWRGQGAGSRSPAVKCRPARYNESEMPANHPRQVTSGLDTCAMSESPSQPALPIAESPPERPPQYSLRSLLIAMGLCSGLFAALSVLPAVWSFAAIWVGLLVAAHVAANAWGKRTFEPGAPRPGDSDPPRTAPLSLAQIERADANRLRHQATLERSRYVTTLVAAGIGGLVGCLVLALIHLHQVSFAACAVWTGASAVISGIAGFVGSGFWQVIKRAPDELAPLP